ncbi:hypothetical protein BD779DRAFT_1533320 [Infundibulicybe gibba]|nr:hypothetical protein BD779DRAFT_1533320 [Infundibulicybe gibba]
MIRSPAPYKPEEPTVAGLLETPPPLQLPVAPKHPEEEFNVQLLLEAGEGAISAWERDMGMSVMVKEVSEVQPGRLTQEALREFGSSLQNGKTKTWSGRRDINDTAPKLDGGASLKRNVHGGVEGCGCGVVGVCVGREAEQEHIDRRFEEKQKSLEQSLLETRKMVEIFKERLQDLERKVEGMEQLGVGQEVVDSTRAPVDQRAESILVHPGIPFGGSSGRFFGPSLGSYMPLMRELVTSSLTLTTSSLDKYNHLLRPFGYTFPQTVSTLPIYALIVGIGMCAVALRVVLGNLFDGLILLLLQFTQVSRGNVMWWFIFCAPSGMRYLDGLPKVSMAGSPQSSNVATSFDMLPSELVEKILAELDCQDILMARRCSRKISAISKARTVWENAIQHYLTMYPWLPKPEESLDAYSALELEQWLVNRTRAQRGWNSATPPQYRQMDQADAGCIVLVPGGRWLLTDPVDGIVTVYDLDTPEMRSKALISPMDDHDAEHEHLMAISINEKSPVLSFNISLLSQPLGEYPDQGIKSRLSIWRATLSGHGREAELTALRITSLDITTDIHPHIILLDGEYVALVTDRTVKILKWIESTPLIYVIAVISCEERPEWVYFLPGARILSFSSSSMVVYEIPPFKLVLASSNPAPTTCTPHVWQVPCCGRGLNRGGISPIWTDSDATNFTISTEDDVQAVTIPISPSQPPSLTKLGLHRYSHRQFILGLHNSVIHDHVASVSALTHRWTDIRGLEFDDGIANTMARLCPGPDGHVALGFIRPCLDEASARLVLVTRVGPWRMMFLIVDFVETIQ